MKSRSITRVSNRTHHSLLVTCTVTLSLPSERLRPFPSLSNLLSDIPLPLRPFNRSAETMLEHTSAAHHFSETAWLRHATRGGTLVDDIM